MDLLFKRYASPFSFMDGMIQTGRFAEFVDSFIDTNQKEEDDRLNWEFFLHKVFEGTYSDFIRQLEINKENASLTERTIETTLQHSVNILNSFNPERSE